MMTVFLAIDMPKLQVSYSSFIRMFSSIEALDSSPLRQNKTLAVSNIHGSVISPQYFHVSNWHRVHYSTLI